MAKKLPTQKEEVTTAVVKNDFVPATTSSASMATHAQFDKTLFAGIKLDIVENAEIFSNDVLIPKVWLTQAMSDHRKEKGIEEGTFVDSQNFDILAVVGGVLRFIVLRTFKRWHTFEIVTEKGKTKKEFISSEIMKFGVNENLPYEETIDGKNIVRRQVISAYILLERDVKAGINKPYIIDFASSSKGGGRLMVTECATLQKQGLPSFVGFFEMTAKEEQFEENSAWVKTPKFGGYLAQDVIPFLVSAYKSLGEIEDRIVIDDSDIIKDNGAQTVDAKVVASASVANAKI